MTWAGILTSFVVVSFASACGRIGFDTLDAASCTSGQHETVVFRAGLDGYAGMVDTFIDRNNPTSEFHVEPSFRWHDDSPMISLQHSLLRFDGVFGPGAVPPGAAIDAATLTLTLLNDCAAPAGTVAETVVEWASTVTWDTFGATAGVQSEDLRTPIAMAPQTHGPEPVDVTASLRAWTLDPTLNNGWIISPAPMNGSGCNAASSDAADPATFPQLTVEFSCP